VASPFVTVLRLAAALALLVGGALGLRAWIGRPADTTEEVPTSRDALASAELPPSELLESLDLLESWELITDESIDVALTSLDTVDEVLLEIDLGKDPLETPAEEPSNG
jgi:hypothetical protein